VAEITAVRLVATDKFLSRSKTGTIGGTVYFQIGGDQFFPERGWTDLPLAVLRGWFEVLVQIAEGTLLEGRAPFFDGDLRVQASSIGAGSVHLDFIHKENTKLSVTTSVRDLLENALAVGGFLLDRCREQGWSNRDTEVLAMLMKEGFRALAAVS